MKKYFLSVTLLFLIVFGCADIVKADVCFVPDGDCNDNVPYNEYPKKDENPNQECEGDECNDECEGDNCEEQENSGG